TRPRILVRHPGHGRHRDLRHAGNQRRDLADDDPGDPVPQHSAQGAARDGDARPAHDRDAAAVARRRQPCGASRAARYNGERDRRRAGEEVAGRDAPRQRLVLSPSGHGFSRRAPLPARPVPARLPDRGFAGGNQGLFREARAGLQGPLKLSARHRELRDKALKGGTRYLPKLREQHKLTARERLDLLLDKDSFVEDGLFANVLAEELPADGVVTGLGTIDGRRVAVMANDPAVKAGSWGARTVEKIIRIQETALRLNVPLFYLVDSAGARITDQIDMFPGRRHAGRIFFNEVRLSGQVPQICLLFGPSAAGGAYIPAFCDVVVMVEGNASMYLGSPRMVEVVVGEKVTLDELGGARTDCTVSGCGDFLVPDDQAAIAVARS